MEKACHDVYESSFLVPIDFFRLRSSETYKYLFLKPLAAITRLSEQVIEEILDIFKRGTRKGLAIKNKSMADVDLGCSITTFSPACFFSENQLWTRFLFSEKSYLKGGDDDCRMDGDLRKGNLNLAGQTF